VLVAAAPVAGKTAPRVVDPFTELWAELRKYTDAGRPYAIAEDLVISTRKGLQLFERAQRQFALMDKAANRRRTDGFRQFLREAAP
jgi:hypothetical protein